MSDVAPGPPRDELAVTLGGGGARGAYQVGVLRHIARRFPELDVPIVTGVSAGGINAALLAGHTGTFEERAKELKHLWSHLSVEDVFRVDAPSLFKQVNRWLAQLLMFGGRRHVPQLQGLVDTGPLRALLARALGDTGDGIPGIQQNIDAGRLRALALVTTRYTNGQTVTWCQGRELALWERPQRTSALTRISIDHVLASSALPLFFPAVKVGDCWYGDGGIRLHSPLAPAIHMGAGRILAISTRYGRSRAEAEARECDGYPPPAQVLGVLLNAIFLDLLDQDAVILERVNRLLRHVPAAERGGLRPVRLLVLRPSQDLGRLASAYEPQLPGLFRFLTRRLGTQRSDNKDALSLVMFQGDYLRKLIELGERDAAAREEEIAAFLAGGPAA